jgi:hypothetical protein
MRSPHASCEVARLHLDLVVDETCHTTGINNSYLGALVRRTQPRRRQRDVQSWLGGPTNQSRGRGDVAQTWLLRLHKASTNRDGAVLVLSLFAAAHLILPRLNDPLCFWCWEPRPISGGWFRPKA